MLFILNYYLPILLLYLSVLYFFSLSRYVLNFDETKDVILTSSNNILLFISLFLF